MGGYRDEYEEDLDEYEDDEAEGEKYEDEYGGVYEEEEEEDSQPPKEVQDYLVLRQRLKEEKRKQLRKELGTGGNAPKSKDNYGYFFGSSQPVIAQRVIQESKSLLENPHLLDKAMTPKSSVVTKSTVPDSVRSKSQALVQTSKVVNGVHKKVQMIKKIRDYSFLDSDDPEPPRKVPAMKPEAPTSHFSERKKDVSSSNGRKVVPTRPNVVGDHRYKQTLSDSRKKLPVRSSTITHNRNRVLNKISSSGPGRAMVVSKSVPSMIPGGDKRVQLPVAKSSTSSSRPQPPMGSKANVPSSKQILGRKEHEELRKPKMLSKQATHAHDESRNYKVLQKQVVVREGLRKPNVLPKRDAHEELRKPKALPKQGATVLKPKVTQPPLPSRCSVRPMAVDNRSRKRQMRPLNNEDDDDPENVRNMIRNMFGYNPSRYGDDEDNSDMEANFEEIGREEKRSARIARKEDEEELRKIEEEERRERLRKKRKLH